MLRGFTQTQFTTEGKTHTVYRRGTGPGVIVMHELPGICPDVVRFANWVVDAGFTVLIPELFGTAGKPVTSGYLLVSFARVCLSREFHLLAVHRSSPITNWLRALCKTTHDELGGIGVGAVGMCLTGNFVLAMMMEPSLLAPVLSQPSLPLPIGAVRKEALHVSPGELANLQKRAAAGAAVLGLRFTEDPSCPRERFETLRRELGKQFEGIEIDSTVSRPGQAPWGPHSVLTMDFIDEPGHPTVVARDRVLAFLKQRLFPQSA